MERQEQVRRYESTLNMQDLDWFAELERDRVGTEPRARGAKRKANTLSAVVEEYLTTYF